MPIYLLLAVNRASSRKAKPVLDFRCIQSQRFSEQKGRYAFGRALEHLVELGSAQDLAVVSNLFDARTDGQQMHQEILGLDRIIGLMLEYSLVAWAWQCSQWRILVTYSSVVKDWRPPPGDQSTELLMLS